MNIKDAIEVLKYLSESIKIGGGKSLIYTRDAEAIDTVLSHITTPNKTCLDDRKDNLLIEHPANQASLSSKKVDTYTAKDMEAFAEWSYKQSYRKMWNKGKYIGYSGMLELWEQERRKKED